MKTLTFKKLSPTAILPTRANPSDAGLDLCADMPAYIIPGDRRGIGTGLAVAIPEGYYGRIAPRSGLAFKDGIDVMAGVLDSSYRGQIVVILINLSRFTFKVDPGHRIAQLIIEKIGTPEAVWGEIEDTDRGSGGFGSTGT